MFFSHNNRVCSPCDGIVKELSSVDDAVFSKGLAGAGFAVSPISSVISSPVKGTVTMIFPTKHAIGIVDKNGREYIVHVGIDTVTLKGNGFTTLVELNQSVEPGTPLLNVDYNVLKKNNLKDDVIVLLGSGLKMILTHTGSVKTGQEVGRCE